MKAKKFCLIESSITMLSLSQSYAMYFKIRSRHVACSTLPDNSDVISYTNVGQFSFIWITNTAKAVQRDYNWGLEFSSMAILFIITKKNRINHFHLLIKLSLIWNETLKSYCLSEAKSCIILFFRIFAALKYSCIVTNYRNKKLTFWSSWGADRTCIVMAHAWWVLENYYSKLSAYLSACWSNCVEVARCICLTKLKYVSAVN
jgi:hypothetical protein